MRHSQKIHDAMQKVFDKLFALSPQELAERLERREVGPIGHLMREMHEPETMNERRLCGADFDDAPSRSRLSELIWSGTGLAADDYGIESTYEC